jgi:hypothetical protein
MLSIPEPDVWIKAVLARLLPKALQVSRSRVVGGQRHRHRTSTAATLASSDPARRVARDAYAKRLVCCDRRIHSVSSWSMITTVLIRPLCSGPITEPSKLLRVGPPRTLASVLSPRDFSRFSFSLGIQSLVPAVPREKPASASRPLYAGCCLPSNQVADRLIPED